MRDLYTVIADVAQETAEKVEASARGRIESLELQLEAQRDASAEREKDLEYELALRDTVIASLMHDYRTLEAAKNCERQCKTCENVKVLCG